MGVSDDAIAHAVDLFSGMGEISTRKMMGGLCLYSEGTIFAILRSDGEVLIKGKGAFIDRLEALGCIRWVYERENGAVAAMPYWTLPEAARDDPGAASALAREALAHL